MNLYPAGCSKMVTITEGELDALSASQMLKSQYTNPVVSLPSATPSKKLWENCKDWLGSFEKIILSVDNDEAGNALADRMARLFPNKIYRMQHGEYKDANDFLQAGKGADFKNLWWKPVKHTPENILNTVDQFLKLYEDTPEHVYYPTGIVALDEKILGLMQGHFTVFKAPTGIGKTELMRYMEYSMLKQGIPIAAWHLEETKLRSLLGLVSYEVGDNLTRRDLIEEKEADGLVREAIGNITKDENFYQFYLGDGQGTDELIDQIRFFSQACDCKFVFFEPIQDVVVGTSEESKEAMLADLSIRLSKLAAELNVGIVTIAHTNENGDPKYCKMIGQRASVIIDLHRDKEADNIEERNTTYLKVEKNRPCSEEGQAGKLAFNLDTFMLREIL
jgi:twinkle protein